MEPIKRAENSFEALDVRGQTISCRYILTEVPSVEWGNAFNQRVQLEQLTHSKQIELDRGGKIVTFQAERQSIENVVQKIDKAIAHANAEFEKLAKQARESEEKEREARVAKDVLLKQIKHQFRHL